MLGFLKNEHFSNSGNGIAVVAHSHRRRTLHFRYLGVWVQLSLFFFPYETEFALFLAVLENSVLPIGLDSLHASLKVTSEL